MTARAEVAEALSRICARCDGQMAITKDAVGRDRLRCPRCDGIAEVRRRPDDAMVPQGLVRANQLPPVAPGQLRCQRCAHGVDGDRRFCPTCSQRGHGERTYQPKSCTKCGAEFQPTGPRAQFCEACR